MIRQISSNILYSVLEKGLILAGNFLVSVILIRCLAREDFGIIGAVAGFYAFVNLINVSLESIVLRDHVRHTGDISRYLYNFVVFNVLKSLVLVVLGFAAALVLSMYYSNEGFIFAVAALTVTLITDSLTAPFSVYASAVYRQRLVTWLSAVKQVLALATVAGLLLYPTLQYLVCRELFIALMMVPLWLYFAKRSLGVSLKNIRPLGDIDAGYIKRSLLSYSVYTHLCGVVTNFIYKSDTFFLSFFTGMRTVGNYNVANSSANMANTISAILGYQNSVALSHTDDAELDNRVTMAFIRLSFYLSVVTLVGYLALGHVYLAILMPGESRGRVYHYMICIVVSLVLVKTLSGPLTAYINIKGSVRGLFTRVLVPVFFITAATYLLSSYLFGALGVAYANIFNAIAWAFLLVREMRRYRFSYRGMFNFREDIDMIKKLIRGMREGAS